LRDLTALALAINVVHACQTTSTTSTRDGAGVNRIVVTSEGSLFVSLEEAESFQAFSTFNGQDPISSVMSESSSSSSNSTVWTLDFGVSAAPASSANSMLFFSDASKAAVAPLTALLGASLLVNAQCAEETSVVFSLPAGWSITDEGAKRVVLDYAGPMAYGYDLTITLPGYSSDSWTEDDSAALIGRLLNFYGDSNLSITITATIDSEGGLVLTLNVLGFTTLVGASASYDSVSANGIVFTDSSASSSSQFRGMQVSVSAPGISCQMGFSADSVGICGDTDGCIDNTCGNGVCIDDAAPLNGYTCECTVGYFDNEGTCTNIDGCASHSCGSNGACVDVAAPGTGFTCNCNSGYVSTDLVCVNEEGCATYPSSSGSCSTTDSSGRCEDVAPPGTGYTCTCSAGYYINTATPSAHTCSYRDCGQPSSQTGYTVASGTTYYGSTRTVTCASGYSGTASSRTCQSNGTWTTSTGCTLNCSTSPTQTGYTIAAGASNQGATRTTSCASGYQGTGTSITCGSNAAWSSASGCTALYSDTGSRGFTTGSGPGTTYCASYGSGWQDPTFTCGATSYSWAGNGYSFGSAGHWIRCTRGAGPTMTSAVGITTYAGSSTTCQGAWDVYCDGTNVGRITSLGTTCTTGPYRGSCQVTYSARSCSYIQLNAVSGNGSGCCNSGGPDSMITAIAVW